jgi:hypothetical protein
MALAEDHQLADAIVTTITGAGLSITPANVIRVWVPKFSSPTLPDGVNVYVLPRGIAVERATASLWDYSITIHIGIVRRQRESTNAHVDPLRDYAEEIFRVLRDTSYGTGDTTDNLDIWFKERTNVDVTYDPEQLDDNQLFISLLALEWGALI